MTRRRLPEISPEAAIATVAVVAFVVVAVLRLSGALL